METIRLEKKEGIATITLARPEVHNAISLEMTEEIQAAVADCAADSQVKVIIFTGEGESFVSGGDLKQFIAARGREQALPILSKVAGMLKTIEESPKPTIAMINGHAIGGGSEFAISCHFRYASQSAMLGFVQIGLHITSGWGGGTRLLDKLPESRALALLLTGEKLTAREAERYGLVDHVCHPDRLREETEQFARMIAAQPLAGIEAYMRLLAWKRAGIPQSERVEREVSQCADLWGNDEHVRLVEKFLRK
ncbi:enoyl-CoA hydratase/isomerase family protein [Brevibacillus ruminantium]|uniref:Enoyl-CoA hydratase/isomerase family protein n=1 Tax=Brevibacillus ruminantium TaxID=2950604 RepID=A0ABY4WK61_9BACL|nr:enoyl-CoA hydratase/isomerase family protein [Brevibacillus ruminantium]USG67536.1 enoyl-CoA hydratase/isomerase family protein [Brevibacillus ruminantium]